MNRIITRFVDFFYWKPFRFIPIETFRYAVLGGLNLLLGMVLYWFCYNYVVPGLVASDLPPKEERVVDFGFVAVSAPIMAFLITFVITFFTGFWLARYVTFKKSTVHGGKQLFRYAQIVAINVLVNYFGLKLLVEVCNFYPSPSYAVIQVVTVAVSYLGQRYYTFRTHRES